MKSKLPARMCWLCKWNRLDEDQEPCATCFDKADYKAAATDPAYAPKWEPKEVEHE